MKRSYNKSHKKVGITLPQVTLTVPVAPHQYPIDNIRVELKPPLLILENKEYILNVI